jgi:peptide-methionine (S)-S-oxide reductase
MRLIRPLLIGVCLLLLVSPSPALAATAEAVFAGGCFWCVEADFDKLPGVKQTISGYTGGRVSNPSYKQVSAGGTGHYEAVKVVYDPKRVSYTKLVDFFLHHVDPTDGGGQFCDRGAQYRTAIFATAAQKPEAEAAIARAAKQLKQPLKTPVLAAQRFWPAEDYHQDYYRKEPLLYRYYRFRCGRDQRVEQVWGTP